MKWWHRPLRISAVQCSYGEDSFDILKNTVIPGAFNTEQLFHLTAEGHMSFYEEKLHGKKLDEYLVEAHKNNINEIIYINVHCFAKKYKDLHPEWVQLDKEGNELKAYDTYYFNCINGGWFEYFLENLKGLCQHDIEGIFLDGPVIAQEGCYCKVCQDKFYRLYGKSIFEASYDEMMFFKVDSVTEFVMKCNRTIKSINPEIMIYLNNSALRADVTGNNSRKVEPYVDLLGAEGGFIHVDRNESLYHAGAMAKFIENQAMGKPTVIFFAGDHKPHSYFMHTAAETKIVYAQSIANGANVWYGIHGPTKMMNTPGGRTAIEMNKFHAANEQYYFKTKPCSKVALMWSMDSANYYSSTVGVTDFTRSQQMGKAVGKKSNHYRAFMGFYEMLARSHIQFDIVDEYNVKNGSISKYDLVILPTCGCIFDETAEGIKNYVQSGGNIISTYDTGFYTQKGQYAKRGLLWDVQGIEEYQDTIEYTISGTGYQCLKKDHWCSESFDSMLIPSPTLAVKAVPSSKAEVVSTYLEPMRGRYVALPSEGYPGMIINQYGKGCSFYIAGTIGEYYCEKSHPALRRLVENIVRKLSSRVLSSDTLCSVEFVLRSQEIENVHALEERGKDKCRSIVNSEGESKGEESCKCSNNKRYILHVINMTGDMKRPVEKIAPLFDVSVTLNLDIKASAIKKISAATGTLDTVINAGNGSNNIKNDCGNNLAFIQTDNEIKIAIPRIEEYEVIVIE